MTKLFVPVVVFVMGLVAICGIVEVLDDRFTFERAGVFAVWFVASVAAGHLTCRVLGYEPGHVAMLMLGAFIVYGVQRGLQGAHFTWHSLAIVGLGTTGTALGGWLAPRSRVRRKRNLRDARLLG